MYNGSGALRMDDLYEPTDLVPAEAPAPVAAPRMSSAPITRYERAPKPSPAVPIEIKLKFPRIGELTFLVSPDHRGMKAAIDPLMPTLQAVYRALTYTENWDSYGARPIAKASVGPTVSLAIVASRFGRQPHAVPSNRGGFVLRLQSDDEKELEINVDATGNITFDWFTQNECDDQEGEGFEAASMAIRQFCVGG